MYSIKNEVVYKSQQIGSLMIKTAYKNEYKISIRDIQLTELNVNENTSILVQLMRFNTSQGEFVDCKKTKEISFEVDGELKKQNTNTLGKALIEFTSTEPKIITLMVDGDCRVFNFKGVN